MRNQKKKLYKQDLTKTRELLGPAGKNWWFARGDHAWPIKMAEINQLSEAWTRHKVVDL